MKRRLPARLYNQGMCGRYRAKRYDLFKLGLREPPGPGFEEFSEKTNLYQLGPRWNVAPSNRMPIVRMDDEGLREMAIARWGLIPSWAKELPKIQPINARAETVPTSGRFRQAFARRRCLVPADGFYEWQGAKPPKQPYFIHLPDDGQFAFAGLWERWKATKDADPLDSYTIITTTPNELMAGIYNRMPVILKPEDYSAWLDNSTPVKHLKSLLACYPDELEAYPVSTHVNSPMNDDPECADRLD